MHEKERHRLILAAVQDKPVVTVQEMVELTERLRGDDPARHRRAAHAEEAAAGARRRRGDLAAAVRRPRRPAVQRSTRPRNIAQKRAIAREAVALCEDGDSIIINGGTTTFQMVYPLATRRMQILTNSFPIAEHLLKHSKNTVLLPGGTIYREQKHRAVAVRERRDPQLLRPADVHGRAGRSARSG